MSKELFEAMKMNLVQWDLLTEDEKNALREANERSGAVHFMGGTNPVVWFDSEHAYCSLDQGKGVYRINPDAEYTEPERTEYPIVESAAGTWIVIEISPVPTYSVQLIDQQNRTDWVGTLWKRTLPDGSTFMMWCTPGPGIPVSDSSELDDHIATLNTMTISERLAYPFVPVMIRFKKADQCETSEC